jgi:hypothetical protein
MGNHDSFRARARQLAKKAIRKEVRTICKTILEDPSIIDSDEFTNENLGWEEKQLQRR